MWSDIAAFAVVPVAIWLISLGYGSLIERLARAALPAALLVPLGFCASIVVALGVYETGVGDTVAVPVVVVPAVLGLVLTGRALPARLNGGWPLVAALAVFLLFDLSVLGSGHWTMTFYNVENDSAYELVLIAHLQAHGTTTTPGLPSTADTVVRGYLSTGYPLGAQSLLAIVSGLLGVSAAAAWQAFISATAGIGAMAIALLSGRTMGARTAALVAVIAMAAALTYEFALQGSIKEIATLVGVLSALAVIRWALVCRQRVGVVLAAVPLAAVLATFNAAGVPYVGALIGCGVVSWLILERPRPERAWWRPLAAAGVTFIVLAVPALLTLRTFLNVATAGYSADHPAAPALGPLFRPLPLSEMSGVWLYGDYRPPVPSGLGGSLTGLAAVIIFVLVAVGAARALIRREPGPLMAVVVMALVLLILYPRVTPYAQAKLLAIASPVALLCAAQALAGARRVWTMVPAAAAALLIVALVIISDALAYHVAPTLPTNRMLALQQIGHRLGDSGPVLDSEFEQFAKYFALPARVIDGPDSPTPEGLVLKGALATGSQYTHSYDLNQENLNFVESFPYILTRNSPVTSRPPANYTLLFSNSFYAVWKRLIRPRVYAHLSLGDGVVNADARPNCAQLGRLVRHAPSGTQLAVSSLPTSASFAMADAQSHSPGWGPNGGIGGGFSTPTPGQAFGLIDLPLGGRYQAWVQGNLPRAVTITVDGRRAGSAAGSNAPGEWLPAGSVTLRPGHHILGVTRRGGGLGPGDGGLNATIGALAVAAAGQAPQLSYLPRQSWRALCRQSANWIELVKG